MAPKSVWSVRLREGMWPGAGPRQFYGSDTGKMPTLHLADETMETGCSEDSPKNFCGW